MTLLFKKFARFFSVLDAAFGVNGAILSHKRPDSRDLARLGINARDFNVRL